MSEPLRETDKIELETVTDWRMIATGAGLIAGVIAVTTAFALLSGPGIAPRRTQMVGSLPPMSVRDWLAPTAVPESPVPAPTRARPVEPVAFLPRSLPPAIVEPTPAPPAVDAPARPRISAPLVFPPESRPRETALARIAIIPAPTASQQEPEPELPGFRRIKFPDEANLIAMLAQQAKEVDLDAKPGSVAKLRGPVTKGRSGGKGARDQQPSAPLVHHIFNFLAEREDLKGLPMIGEKECQSSDAEAKVLCQVSLAFRRVLGIADRRGERDQSLSRSLHPDFELMQALESPKLRLGEAAMPALVQMLQTRSAYARLKLVDTLTKMQGEKATAALAQRALFDTAHEVREAAVKALQDRPRPVVRRHLLAGFRYPWAPAADHAAEALVALNDQDAVFALIGQLDEPDPGQPVRQPDNQWVVKELVKVNHLGNCLLCHAASTNPGDLVRGLVPEKGKPIPVVYYDSPEGSFVRADVVYLRQDFSVVQPVEKANPWPDLQRFDYMTRVRELSKEEVAKLPPQPEVVVDWRGYPQKQAVLWALRELTGEVVGENSEMWYRALEGRYQGTEW